MKIFIATRGEYSDYRVVGAFSTEALAKAAGDDFIECEVDELASRILSGFTPWRVRITREGTGPMWSSGRGPVAYHLTIEDDLEPPKMVPRIERFRERFLTAVVLARDEVHATKIANDYRVQFIASGQWERDE